MALWKIYPAADPSDSRWQGRRIWREVVVRAPSAAMARVLAAELESNPDAPSLGNESLSFRSGFEDEKLYWVVRVSEEDAAALGGNDGPYRVLQPIAGDPTRSHRGTASGAEEHPLLYRRGMVGAARPAPGQAVDREIRARDRSGRARESAAA